MIKGYKGFSKGLVCSDKQFYASEMKSFSEYADCLLYTSDAADE